MDRRDCENEIETKLVYQGDDVMTRLTTKMMFVVTGWFLLAGNAFATPFFYIKFEAKYAGENADPAFAKLVKETKCNVCHVAGAPKKMHNNFGTAAQAAGFLKMNYTKERVEGMPDVVDKEMDALFEKVLKTKNPAGKIYGDLIKAGKLPGE